MKRIPFACRYCRFAHLCFCRISVQYKFTFSFLWLKCSYAAFSSRIVRYSMRLGRCNVVKQIMRTQKRKVEYEPVFDCCECWKQICHNYLNNRICWPVSLLQARAILAEDNEISGIEAEDALEKAAATTAAKGEIIEMRGKRCVFRWRTSLSMKIGSKA